jgi:prepilin-type N-terminal cleavage/methylation domain-containing protein
MNMGRWQQWVPGSNVRGWRSVISCQRPCRARRLDAPPRHGRFRHRRPDGFTLVELIIVVLILAILAAILAPRLSGAAIQAQSSAVRQDLRYLRQQIHVYRAQHHNVPPGYPNGDTSQTPTVAVFLAQMMNPTSAGGEVGSTPSPYFRFGPYIAEMPINPINGSAQVLVILDGQPMPARPTGPTNEGWVYKPETLDFRAYVAEQDENGVFYYDY